MRRYLALTFLLLLSFPDAVNAQQLHHLSVPELIERQAITPKHTELFATLQVQDFQGCIKPVHTLALELLRKVHGKGHYDYQDANGISKRLTATQVFLGMQFKPDSWQLLPLIKINKEVRVGLDEPIKTNKNGYAAVAQFFDFGGNYKLKSYVARAFERLPRERNAFDKDIIKIDERVNITWGIFNGQFLKVFPKQFDPEHKWYAPSDTDAPFTPDDNEFFNRIIPTYLAQLEEGKKTDNWHKAGETVELIKNFQALKGSTVRLPESTVRLEIWYNEHPLFFYSLIAYTLLGIFALVLGFFRVFTKRNHRALNVSILFCIGASLFTFSLHAAGIGLRWYISGHAPWSNGYEATVFIAWISVLAGLLFARKNIFALAVAAIMAMCLLGIAHGSLMNPEVTNLVPVLKSYWLLIHVAVITASYGFLGLGSLLAFITLVFLSVKTWKPQSQNVTQTITELTTINQLSSTAGLYLLTIGTFLGGIWANESWGRYWGWDPKETWALISIIIYAFVLHLRIMIPKNYTYAYNVCSLFAVGSILMTFFGVNYYLSGLHSYGKGDSFPIPDWLYITVGICTVVAFLPKLLSVLPSTSTRKATNVSTPQSTGTASLASTKT